MVQQRLFGGVLLALGTLLFVAVARPELHHFDDFAYVYAAKNYSIHALAHGQFESSNVAGFYNAKIGHLVLLQSLIAVFGDGLAAIKSLEFFYSLLVVLSAAALGATLAVLQRSGSAKAMAIGGLFLTIPVTVYFSAKLLAEGPALFFAMLSLLALAKALRTGGGARQWVLLALGAAALTMSVYTRIQLVVMPLGMWVALLVVPPEGMSRWAVLRATVTTGVLALGFFGLCEWLFKLNLVGGLMTASVVAAQHTYLADKLVKTAVAFGPFLFAIPLALLQSKHREMRFMLVWCLCASAPLLLAFSFLETRWLLVGAPALAAMTYLCAENLWLKLRLRGWASPAVAAILVAALLSVVVWSNRMAQQRTEYGLDETALIASKVWIDEHYRGLPILVPWTHSDYHYLSFAYPRDAIYTVNSESFFTPTTFIKDAPHWVAAMSDWYGSRYVGDYAALKRLNRAPWLAIAWNRSPGAWDGLKTSWVATDPRLKRSLVHREGPYQVYLLEDSATQPK